METKICGRCKEIKNVCFFGINKKTKSGYRSTCNDCRKIESKNYLKNNYDKRKETIKKYYENNKDIIKEKEKLKTNLEKEKIRKIKLISYHKNKEKHKERLKLYRQKNKKNRTKYEYFKIKNDPIYKMSAMVRGRIKTFLKKINVDKTSSTFEMIGCTPQFLKEHLEMNFKEGMSWENYGLYGWHIDHIIPLSSAEDEDGVYKLCHYTNLQPLWAKENLSKGSKIINM